MNIIIRKATISDYAAIHKLIKEFSIFQKTPEKIKITLEEMIAQKDYINCYVAVNEDDDVIGYTSYSLVYYSWVGKSIYLDDVFVTEAFRGNQVGFRLMQTVFDIAKKEKCNRVRWQVSRWNTHAMKFYKKLGALIDYVELNCDLIINW